MQVPLLDGAGQFRAVGRIVGLLASRDELAARINKAFMDARAGGPELARVSEALGVPTVLGGATPAPIVVICASVAGGTGAGISLDVVEMVRKAHELGGFPVLILFTADIFDFGPTRSMAANSLGLLSEVMASYWGKPSDPIVPSSVPRPGSGPHALFVVGRHSIEGGDLGNTVSVYRAVGEAMSTWVTEPRVQEQIHNFITTNWESVARDRMGGYPFGKEYQRGGRLLIRSGHGNAGARSLRTVGNRPVRSRDPPSAGGRSPAAGVLDRRGRGPAGTGSRRGHWQGSRPAPCTRVGLPAPWPG